MATVISIVLPLIPLYRYQVNLRGNGQPVAALAGAFDLHGSMILGNAFFASTPHYRLGGSLSGGETERTVLESRHNATEGLTEGALGLVPKRLREGGGSDAGAETLRAAGAAVKYGT